MVVLFFLLITSHLFAGMSHQEILSDLLTFEKNRADRLLNKIAALPEILSGSDVILDLEIHHKHQIKITYKNGIKKLVISGKHSLEKVIPIHSDIAIIKGKLHLIDFENQFVTMYSLDKKNSTAQYPLTEGIVQSYFRKKLKLPLLKATRVGGHFFLESKKHTPVLDFTYKSVFDLASLHHWLAHRGCIKLTFSSTKILPIPSYNKVHFTHFSPKHRWHWVYPHLNPFNYLPYLSKSAEFLQPDPSKKKELSLEQFVSKMIRSKEMHTIKKRDVQELKELKETLKEGSMPEPGNETGCSEVYFLKNNQNKNKVIFKPIETHRETEAMVNLQVIDGLCQISGLDDICLPTTIGSTHHIRIRKRDKDPTNHVLGMFQKYVDPLSSEYLSKLEPIAFWKAVVCTLLCDLQDLHNDNILLYQEGNKVQLTVIDTDEYCLSWSLPAYQHKTRFELDHPTRSRGLFEMKEKHITLQELASLASIVKSWDISSMQSFLDQFLVLDLKTGKIEPVFDQKRIDDFSLVVARIKNYVIHCYNTGKTFGPFDFAYYVRPDLNPNFYQKDIVFEEVFCTDSLKEMK